MWIIGYIHPFGDGNGRVGIALALCVLRAFGVYIAIDNAKAGIKRRRHITPILEALTEMRSNPLAFSQILDTLVSKLKQQFGRGEQAMKKELKQ